MFAKGSSAAAVLGWVYERGRVSKQQLAEGLRLSLPTVSKALATLGEAGLVRRAGALPSTGGRPAAVYELCADARIALGVELAGDGLRCAAVDLYGRVVAQLEERLAFRYEDAYLDTVAELIERVMGLGQPQLEAVLGVTIAIQGLVASGRRVTFGGLLGPDDASVTLGDFARRLPCPVRLVHDAEAAAYAELWRHHELRSFAYLSLNDHLGSALVFGGELLRGGALGAGVVEHMVLDPGGAACYCGGHGCAETSLGALALERRAGLSADEFFARLRSGDARCAELWGAYLADLALLIHNVRMVTGCDVVVGGRLARYLAEADLRSLRMRARAHGALGSVPFALLRGHYGDWATVTGAGLLLIEDFLVRYARRPR